MLPHSAGLGDAPEAPQCGHAGEIERETKHAAGHQLRDAELGLSGCEKALHQAPDRITAEKPDAAANDLRILRCETDFFSCEVHSRSILVP